MPLSAEQELLDLPPFALRSGTPTKVRIKAFGAEFERTEA
jgi:hypothetical protein